MQRCCHFLIGHPTNSVNCMLFLLHKKWIQITIEWKNELLSFQNDVWLFGSFLVDKEIKIAKWLNKLTHDSTYPHKILTTLKFSHNWLWKVVLYHVDPRLNRALFPNRKPEIQLYIAKMHVISQLVLLHLGGLLIIQILRWCLYWSVFQNVLDFS